MNCSCDGCSRQGSSVQPLIDSRRWVSCGTVKADVRRRIQCPASCSSHQIIFRSTSSLLLLTLVLVLPSWILAFTVPVFLQRHCNLVSQQASSYASNKLLVHPRDHFTRSTSVRKSQADVPLFSSRSQNFNPQNHSSTAGADSSSLQATSVAIDGDHLFALTTLSLSSITNNHTDATGAGPSNSVMTSVTHWSDIMRQERWFDNNNNVSASLLLLESVLSDEDCAAIETYWDRLMPTVSYLGTVQVAKIYKALCVAYRAHRGQVRKSGQPFIIHVRCIWGFLIFY